jgi:hypothetical protein
MSDKIRVIDMTQSTEHALSKVLEFAGEHPESQFLYEESRPSVKSVAFVLSAAIY